MRAMLASDLDETKLVFPAIAQPKIDGVRGWNPNGELLGRSLKKHKNKFSTARFSHPSFAGLDGELAAADKCHPDLCRLTSSALSTIEGTPSVFWWLFDYVTTETVDLPYEVRLEKLAEKIAAIYNSSETVIRSAFFRLIPSYRVHSLEEFLALEQRFLDEGYEGIIYRSLTAKHKDGRSTVREGGLLRLKRFEDAEAEVLKLVEGETNMNEAKLDERGYTERSTHQENMVPNGMVGRLICMFKGDEINVSPGKMTNEEATRYWNEPGLLVGKTIKFKHFAKGVKDKPRFATFQGERIESDIGGS